MGGGTDLLTVTHDAGIVVDGRDRLMALLSREVLPSTCCFQWA